MAQEELELWPLHERSDKVSVNRKWAELAFWFQPVTFAAGVRPVPHVKIQNVVEDVVAGVGGAQTFDSH